MHGLKSADCRRAHWRCAHAGARGPEDASRAPQGRPDAGSYHGASTHCWIGGLHDSKLHIRGQIRCKAAATVHLGSTPAARLSRMLTSQ